MHFTLASNSHGEKSVLQSPDTPDVYGKNVKVNVKETKLTLFYNQPSDIKQHIGKGWDCVPSCTCPL